MYKDAQEKLRECIENIVRDFDNNFMGMVLCNSITIKFCRMNTYFVFIISIALSFKPIRKFSITLNYNSLILYLVTKIISNYS